MGFQNMYVLMEKYKKNIGACWLKKVSYLEFCQLYKNCD